MQEIKSLLKELSNADWWARGDAIRKLFSHSGDDYFPCLEEALKDHENANLRNAAMECYIFLGVRGLPSLSRLIRNDDPEVRLFAANLLGDIADRRSIPELINAITDTEYNVRIACAESLGKMRDPEALSALRKAVEDEPWVAMSAIKSIGEIGGDSALEILYGCLERDEYRGITFDAIEKAGNENSIRHLTPFVDRDDMRELALRAVVNIAIRKGIRLMPEYFINMIPLLLSLQRSSDPETGRAAFIALAWAEDLRALPHLIDALNDEDLQEYAIGGILNIGERAVPEIIDALKDTLRPQRNVLARLLSMAGEHIALLQFCNDEDPEVRVEVTLALEEIDSARAKEILLAMMDDPDDEVRMAARKVSHSLKSTK